ncbi:MAG: hypothetical protein KatS3mg090_0204 [Patescibacteria group bacterium]|nr:MAG: hypothetical protein KatS3mg090_0204 [Patescibacteria group bacterium]
MLYFYSQRFGKLNLDEVKSKIIEFLHLDKKSKYSFIIGSDSQRIGKDKYFFVSALIVHRVGSGAIYFYQKKIINQKMSLKTRIYNEALLSLQMAEKFLEIFKQNGFDKFDFQIHLDIGNQGETKSLVSEITTLIQSSGYNFQIKPNAPAASKVADKHT